MASADYRLCDVCNQKAFYDADLAYEARGPYSPFRVAGKSQGTVHLGRLGDWAVICIDCAKTHRTRVERIEEGMRKEESAALLALGQLLDLTDESDWPLIHSTVREDVARGKYPSEFEKSYQRIVEQKLIERGAA